MVRDTQRIAPLVMLAMAATLLLSACTVAGTTTTPRPTATPAPTEEPAATSTPEITPDPTATETPAPSPTETPETSLTAPERVPATSAATAEPEDDDDSSDDMETEPERRSTPSITVPLDPTPDVQLTPEADDDEADAGSNSRAGNQQRSNQTEREDDDDIDDDAEATQVDEADELQDPGQPIRLRIDRINVDSRVEYVGLTDKGAMDVPRGWFNVGWYRLGARPGMPGNAVIAGHYDSPTGRAIFYRLNELRLGDQITVITEYGEELVFEVHEIETIRADNAPMEKIFGKSDERNLNLITCDGVWDRRVGMYDERLIVYTRLVEE